MKIIIFSIFIGFCFLLAHGGDYHDATKSEVTEKIHSREHNDKAHSMSHENESPSMDDKKNRPMSHIPVVAEELDRVGIEEKIGDFVDQSLTFYNSRNEKVVLGDLIEEKPVIFTFAYYSCPLICQFVLQAQKKAMEELTLELGKDYQAVTISFDDRDTMEVTANIKSKYVDDPNDENWHFLYGNSENIKQITSSLGFKFKWIEANQEFAHSAAIYVITPNGKISRYFYGLSYNPFELKLAVLEAKKENAKSTLDRVLLYCYRYDHEARGYVLHAWNLMRTGGVVTIFLMSTFLFIMFKREKKYIKK